jgi:hypothetical protein
MIDVFRRQLHLVAAFDADTLSLANGNPKRD